MSNTLENQKSQLQLQLDELVKVGVGGKYVNNSNYNEQIKEELEFEEAMLRGGILRYRNNTTKAVIKGQESTTIYGQVLQQKYITKLSECINLDIKTMTGGGAGNRLTALKLICQCLPKSAFNNGIWKQDNQNIWDTCSLIVLKNVIDGISDETTMNKLAIKIGTGLMLEARITLFKDMDRTNYDKTYHKLEGKNLPQKGSRYNYKQRVWTYMMNRAELDFDDWGKEGRLHLGVKMMEYLEKLGLIRHQNRKLNKYKTVTYVEATPKIIAEIKNFNIKNEALLPKFLPMLMPPRKWNFNPFVGGYYGKKHNHKNKPEDIKHAL
jgi:DNA-directed RNA polymerase|tara:strand:+ start:329 stop:1297 length:969 start_codon:yes stop_codon:yes gene_type:complete